ncbi:uncharacterized protein BJX67DRAFT_361131 [Aspergillus lucknowensis]|uniref:Utp8 beta-propeller domain-containing protein n=1 Tax=Aspergillus lucknowensis TaxID=176173 RepID=A0ABR4LM05_9EURO
MDLQPPSVLAQLPRPLHASTGNTHIGEVYSLAESKKRKRYEVAVAVDGEAVNLYNIQTPKLVTSYAVPPQSSFSCRPCSLRQKLPNGSGVKRQTYVAAKKEIKGFIEKSAGVGASAPTISSPTFVVEDSSSPPVFIGVVPGSDEEDGETDQFDVLAVHRDGRVRRLSSDLETQRWSLKHTELAKGRSVHEVHGCFLLEYDDAKKSLLKRRPDISSLAVAEPAISGSDEPSILLFVSYPVDTARIRLNEVKIQIFSVPARSHGRYTDESQRMRHLLTVSLPDLDGEEIESNRLHWQFHSGSSGLSLSFEKGFVNFDLSQYTPVVTSKLLLDGEDFSSVMRVSPHSVIGAGKSMIALYDTQYKSIHRSIVTENLPSAVIDGRTTFICYFAKLDIVLATKGSSLLAFDLGSQSTSGISGKRARDGLLIDAIGCGIGTGSHWEKVPKKQRTDGEAALGLGSPEETDRWNKFAHDLRKCSDSQDATTFDRVVQAYFGGEDAHSLPSPEQYVNAEVVLFLLSLIFSVKGDVTSNDKLSASSSFNMSVTLWPTRTCEWLVRLGYLYPGNIEAALRRSYKPRILPTLPTGTFTQALINFDHSLGCLVTVLQGPAAFNADELAYALKLFLTTARSFTIPMEEDKESLKTLTNGEDATKHDNPVSLKTKNTLSESRSTSQASLHTTFTGLNTTLLKLHAHPSQTITAALRSLLTRADIISTIHHLRLSLATGGHTTRFTETPPTPITPHLISPTLPLDTIINLLNTSIDAIGPSGWVSVTPSRSDLAADPEAMGLRDLALIAEMKSEVSAALAGVEEATFLSGILREYLRYATSVDVRTTKHLTTGSTADENATSSTSIRHEKLNGADLLVYGANDEDGEGEGDASGKLLPLSLKAAKDVSKTKVLKGKVVQRSKREIGYLRRKAAGKYTFERLLI